MSNTRATAADAAGLDTFPRLLMHHARQRPNRPAMREKEYGIWQTYTWAEVAERVRSIASGLAELGFKRGDRLAVVGDNRPRLYWSVAAAQCRGVVHMARLLAGLTRLMPDGREPFADVLARVGPRLPRHGLVIAVSDFYDDALTLPVLRRLSRAGHDVVAVQTLADEERRLVIADDAELIDAETGQTRPVAAAAARAGYQARLTAWQRDLRAALMREGIEPVSLTTADRVDHVLRRFLQARRGGA